MKKLSILVFTALTGASLPAAIQAAQGGGALYSNVGATIVTNDSHNENAYFFEIGYNHKLDEIFSADFSYKKVETLDSSVSPNSNDFVQAYDLYSIGVRADQNLGELSVYGAAGASYVKSELTTWDTTAGAEQVDKDETLKPYARAGINIASPYDKRLTFGAAIDYQMLPHAGHATSLSGGFNYAF
jgi:hypothetical protein